MKTPHTPSPIDFEMGGYKFRFGPSQIQGEGRFEHLIDTLTLWMWNGYYWHVEIANCTDLEGAKNSMQFKLAFEKQDREIAALKAKGAQ